MISRHEFLTVGSVGPDGPAKLVKDRPPVTGRVEKRRIGVRPLLEWAFGVELATLDFNEVATVGGTGLPGIGVEFVLMQQAILGVRIDTSRGRSAPAGDAELVASVVSAYPDRAMALRVAELARAGSEPDWIADPTPRCSPVKWRKTSHGLRGAQAPGDVWRYAARMGRNAGQPVERRGMCCPVEFHPTAAKVASARRAYLDWWGALLQIASLLRAVDLARFELTGEMPPMTPWKSFS